MLQKYLIFSIIMPTYNRPKQLTNCLLSQKFNQPSLFIALLFLVSQISTILGLITEKFLNHKLYQDV